MMSIEFNTEQARVEFNMAFVLMTLKGISEESAEKVLKSLYESAIKDSQVFK